MHQDRRLKIAYVTSTNPNDRRAWSGTHYFIAQALQKHCGEVHYIGPLKSRAKFFVKMSSRAIRVVSLNRKRYKWQSHNVLVSKEYGRLISSMISREKFDLIFAPAASTEIAHISTDIPIICLSDATFSLMKGYYRTFSKLMKTSIRQGNLIESLAIKKASLCIFSSEWAATSAIDDYWVERDKVKVIPFGANIDHVPPVEFAIKNRLEKRRSTKDCKLFFLGVDWERKGGDIAFDTLVELEKMGVSSELTVCGCIPPKGVFHKKLHVVPFLDKNKQKDRDKLNQLLLDADFLLLPTRHECFGIVFCEANAFGLPIITTDTGGVSSAVKNGVNGFMLPLDAKGHDYASLIQSIYSDDLTYAELVRNSRFEFDNRLNWDAWGEAVRDAIDGIISQSNNRLESCLLKG